MSYASIYVAFTRVAKADHIRLFIHGSDYRSVAYLSTLRPDPAINSFFAGHSARGGSSSTGTAWNEDIALQKYDRLKH